MIEGRSPLRKNVGPPHYHLGRILLSTHSLRINLTWRYEENEDHDEVRNDKGEGENRTETTFVFPILDTAQDVNMKNIPPSSLPTFYGKSNEDLDTFFFEFEMLCRSYNCLQDAHKLKLFPATLKDSTLRWFMGLGEYSIRNWEDIKTTFLQKYQEYCKPRDSRMLM